MKNAFEPYPDAATDDLIVAVIDAMSDWFSDKRNETYCRTLHVAISMADSSIGSRYKHYRLKRIRKRDIAGTADAIPAGNIPYSPAEYIAIHYPPQSLDLYKSALLGLLYGLDLIAGGFSTVYHPRDRRHHFLGVPFTGRGRIEKVAREWEAGRVQLYSVHVPASFYSASADTALGSALYSLLVFIFGYIKGRGCDWQFRSDTLGIAKLAEERGYDFDNTFEGEYFEEVAEQPPLEVEAYHKVYGRLPDGYPPRLGDYDGPEFL